MQAISREDLESLSDEERAVWKAIQELAIQARELAGHRQHYTLEFAAFDITLQAEHVLKEKK